MRSILGLIFAFGLALGAFAQGEVRRFNTLADLLASNPNGFATAGRATAIVSGNTNATDSWSRVLAYSSADTNAADNLTIFSPGSGVGRWRLLYLQNPTNSNVRAGIIPPWETNKFWANGAWVYLTNVFSFSAGSNITVTPSATGVSIASTATGSSLSFNGTTVSNPNITNSALVVWDGAGTNRFAYITNYFSWEGIELQVPNLKDTAYIYWVPSGSDLRAYVVQGGLDLSRLEDMQPERIIGRYTPTTGVPQYIEIGSNLSLSTNGVLSAVVSTGATNGTPVSVDGALLIEANFADNSELDFGASGTNVSASLVSGSIGTNKLSAATAALLLDSHLVNDKLVMPLVLTNNASDLGRIVFYTNGNGHVLGYATNLGAATTTVGVNGTGVSAPNLANAAEVSFTVASGTNIYAALNAGSVALSKLANATSPSLVGRAASGSGALESISIGTGLNLAINGVLSATGTNLTTIRVDGTTVSGPNIQDSTEIDWTVSGSTNVSASLFNSSVTLSKIQDISTSRLLGRSTAGSGVIEQILIGSGLSLSSGTLSATGGGGGGTNASMVYVDGVAVSDPNFADSSTKFLFSVSGTNITGQLPGRDFGDISVGPAGDSMTIDADSVALGTDTTGNYVATVAGTANEVSVSGSGSETAAVTLSLPATIDLGGKTSFEIPNAAAPTTDAFGEIAGDNNAWAASRGAVQFFDGTANTLLVGTLASDTPSNGQVPKWNTGGTITWEDDAGSGGAGTVVTVDGGSDLARANFADASTTGIFDISGTNITFRLPDRDFGDITISSSGASMAIDSDAVTYAKMQNVSAASRILGRGDSGSGDVQELTLGSGLSISGTTLSASGGGSSTNILVNGTLVSSANLVNSSSVRFDVSGSSISAVVTNGYTDGHYAGGFLPLFAGQSNALTGDLHFKQGSDIRVPMWESGTDKNAVGLRASNGVLGLSEFNTNDFTVLETFMTVDPTGSGDVITFGNSGFDNSVVFEADVNFSGGMAAASLSVNDDAYGAGWNGSTNVPTKNAVYDKIESLSSGGGGDVYTSSNNVFTGTNTFSAPTVFGGQTRTNWPQVGEREDAVWYTEFSAPQGESAGRFGLPYGGLAIGSGATAVVGSDSGGSAVQGYVRIPASTTAGSGYAYLTSISGMLLTTNCVFEWQFRPLATNNTVIIGRYGWMDSASGTPTDGLYCERDGMVLTLIGRSNNVANPSATTYSIASNAWYYGQISTALIGSDTVATMRIWDSTPSLLSTIAITNGLPTASGRDTGAGVRVASTNNVAVNLDDISMIQTIMPLRR